MIVMNNDDQELTEFLDGVIGVVEANSFETLSLWRECTEELKKTWVDNNRGYWQVVGKLNKMPVCITLQTSVVDGHKILFYHPTSQVVDYRKIDKWLNRNMPKTAFRSNGYLNRTNAMNFYNVMR